MNISPKGGTPLHLIDGNTVAYLDYPGSGNETARHILAGGPVTIMAMSMEPDNAAIVRLYCKGHIETDSGSEVYQTVLGTSAEHLAKTPRQIFCFKVHKTQTSCGYGVPVFEFVEERSKTQRDRAYRE